MMQSLPRRADRFVRDFGGYVTVFCSLAKSAAPLIIYERFTANYCFDILLCARRQNRRSRSGKARKRLRAIFRKRRTTFFDAGCSTNRKTLQFEVTVPLIIWQLHSVECAETYLSYVKEQFHPRSKCMTVILWMKVAGFFGNQTGSAGIDQ